MAIITTGSAPKAYWPGILGWWGVSYDAHGKEYPDLFEMLSSNKAYEEFVQLTGMGLAPVKPQGEGVRYDAQLQGFTTRYTNVTIGLGFVVTREEAEDNLYEAVAKSRAKMLAFSMNQTKEVIAANVYNRVTNTSYLGGDGVALGSASHPSRAGTWSNILNPGADLSEAALEDLLTQIMKTENDLGLKIALMGKCLIVPPDLAFDAERILKSTLQSHTANNALTAIKNMGLLPEGIKINHYLTDADAYFIRTNCPSGMTGLNRRAIDFTRDNDFDTENDKYKSTERYVFNWTDPRGLFSSVPA